VAALPLSATYYWADICMWGYGTTSTQVIIGIGQLHIAVARGGGATVAIQLHFFYSAGPGDPA
jgi:hypothetical protein